MVVYCHSWCLTLSLLSTEVQKERVAKLQAKQTVAVLWRRQARRNSDMETWTKQRGEGCTRSPPARPLPPSPAAARRPYSSPSSPRPRQRCYPHAWSRRPASPGVSSQQAARSQEAGPTTKKTVRALTLSSRTPGSDTKAGHTPPARG